jgi:Xaa-Pro aminopeptidase
MKNFFSWLEFKERREKLLKLIKDEYQTEKGAIVLFGSFELPASKFKQESSFYYFTGINEPGSVLFMSLDGNTKLLVPNAATRLHWVSGCIDPKSCKPEDIGFNNLDYVGQPISGFEFSPFFSQSEVSTLLDLIKLTINDGGKIFTLNPDNQTQYFQQRFILERLNSFMPILQNNSIDISPLAAQLRRVKSKKEIEAIYKAIDITIMGHEAAIQVIADGKNEAEVQAAIEYVFTSSKAQLAFASIVGSGKNSTVLHYTANNKELKKGELVVVDIGAEFEHYCGDITRTYPVSGKFSKRQKEVYELVLSAQEYIASLAKPGMWLSNKEHPDKSLNHLTREFFKERGYDKYFLHSLGHFLGLDVHDVGNFIEPLRPGDVITIEPGLYIDEENLGVRIEDNYWIVEDGSICLSENLPKNIEEIEEILKK